MKEFFQNCLPFWNELKDSEKELLLNEAILRKHSIGTIFYHSGGECSGVEIVKSGRARVYISSPDGREITLFRILDNDFCMMSAACMLNNINFGISLETETDCEIVIIPREIYKRLLDENASVKNFTMELVASKFSDVMWLLEQLVFSNMGKRLADALIEQSVLCGSHILEITHEKIALDLGTAREVVTRLLKQFQLDGLVTLSRGKIELIDEKALKGIK
jgi:CRP/FNR family transcriptional regulator